jgi:hypothetical protein
MTNINAAYSQGNQPCPPPISPFLFHGGSPVSVVSEVSENLFSTYARVRFLIGKKVVLFGWMGGGFSLTSPTSLPLAGGQPVPWLSLAKQLLIDHSALHFIGRHFLRAVVSAVMSIADGGICSGRGVLHLVQAKSSPRCHRRRIRVGLTVFPVDMAPAPFGSCLRRRRGRVTSCLLSSRDAAPKPVPSSSHSVGLIGRVVPSRKLAV